MFTFVYNVENNWVYWTLRLNLSIPKNLVTVLYYRISLVTHKMSTFITVSRSPQFPEWVRHVDHSKSRYKDDSQEKSKSLKLLFRYTCPFKQSFSWYIYVTITLYLPRVLRFYIFGWTGFNPCPSLFNRLSRERHQGTSWLCSKWFPKKSR